MTTRIVINNLTKRFGNVTAVNNVSLIVEPGTFLTLLGPSGCGKTTLLRCVAGLEDPDGGEIYIGNKLVFSQAKGISVPAGQRELGMVFQNYALWPHMKVDKNISFALEIQKLGQEEMQQRIRQSLAEVKMEGYEDRYPREMSGGQQQRIALARMLAYRPKVFLMDEPLSNLDARLRMDMRAELKRLHHSSGATTIYVTHDQAEALTMADLIAVMREGVLQQVAPVTVTAGLANSVQATISYSANNKELASEKFLFNNEGGSTTLSDTLYQEGLLNAYDQSKFVSKNDEITAFSNKNQNDNSRLDWDIDETNKILNVTQFTRPSTSTTKSEEINRSILFYFGAATHPTTTSVPQVPVGKLTFYPNPVRETVTIVNSTEQNCNFRILSIDGKPIKSGVANESINAVSVVSLPQGAYILQLSSGNKLTSGILIKQ